MATDVSLVLANLTRFYDFRDKIVIHVGAGGGQFIGYAAAARHVLAIDSDAEAVTRLEAAIESAGLRTRFTVRQAPFQAVTDLADVVFFEFCLHEMEDPGEIIRHARTLAPEVLISDHAPDSRWAWYTAETEKATRSWAAAERAGIARVQDFSGWQRFPDLDSLREKVRPVGEPALSRASAHAGPIPIEIPMSYRIAVL